MNNSVYQINKGINKSIEFKGLKAQYIWYLGGGLVFLLIFFAVIYICGINVFICLALIVLLATASFMNVYKLSRTYGEHRLMKKIAKKAVLKVIKKDTEKENMLMQSLRKGNLQAVTIEKDGNSNKMFIEAGPQYKKVTLYDFNMKQIPKEELGNYQSVEQNGV